jgi:hypothetical protein
MSQPKYPHTPGHKGTDTGKAAAGAMKSKAASLRTKALEVLQQFTGGLTADECAAEMHESILAIRPRFSELRKMKRIADTGVRRTTASGLTARVMRFINPPVSETIVTPA